MHLVLPLYPHFQENARLPSLLRNCTFPVPRPAGYEYSALTAALDSFRPNRHVISCCRRVSRDSASASSDPRFILTSICTPYSSRSSCTLLALAASCARKAHTFRCRALGARQVGYCASSDVAGPWLGLAGPLDRDLRPARAPPWRVACVCIIQHVPVKSSGQPVPGRVSRSIYIKKNL